MCGGKKEVEGRVGQEEGKGLNIYFSHLCSLTQQNLVEGISVREGGGRGGGGRGKGEFAPMEANSFHMKGSAMGRCNTLND